MAAMKLCQANLYQLYVKSQYDFEAHGYRGFHDLCKDTSEAISHEWCKI